MLTSSTTPHELASLLRTTYPNLCHTVYGDRPDNLYKTFYIPKKNGGRRLIASPIDKLVSLQHRLKPLLEQLYSPHPAATAFIQGRGILVNARAHIGRALVFNIDLSNFYGSINFGRVRGLLRAPPYNLRHDTAQMVATICCYKGAIPQGAPTSPVLSNMVSRQLDRKLSLLAKKNHSFYTRYADDITFSFRNKNHEGICRNVNGMFEPTSELIDIVNSSGFTLNSRKTRGEDSKSRQVVTGLKVNKKVNVDRRYIRTTKAMIHDLFIDVEAANLKFLSLQRSKSSKRLENVVAGRINFIGMVKGVDSTVYQMLARKYNRLPIEKKVSSRSAKLVETDEKFKELAAQDHLKKCVWILDFEGVSDATDDVQGTAFMIEGQKVLTCSHTFEKAGNPQLCSIHRIHEPGKRYFMRIVKRCPWRDLVELEFVEEVKDTLPSLEIYHREAFYQGYRLSVAGFPDHLPGHKHVTVLGTSVTSHVVVSTVNLYEVDAEISAGLSGGPVLNDFSQVVGMALRGRTVSVDMQTGDAAIEGRNAFVSAQHFLEI